MLIWMNYTVKSFEPATTETYLAMLKVTKSKWFCCNQVVVRLAWSYSRLKYNLVDMGVTGKEGEKSDSFSIIKFIKSEVKFT